MIATAFRVLIVPLAVVNRRPHFWRITEIHVLAGAIIFVPPEILRIVDVGIVIEPFPVVVAVGSPPHAVIGAVGRFLGLAGGGKTAAEHQGAGECENDATNHGVPLKNLWAARTMPRKRHLPCYSASAERNIRIERISGKTGVLSIMRNLAKLASFAGAWKVGGRQVATGNTRGF